MKLIHEERLIDSGQFSQSSEYDTIHQDIAEAIKMVVWPAGSSSFTVCPVRKGNGVKPIKKAFQTHLKEQGWLTEQLIKVGQSSKPGPIDVVKPIGDKIFAVEWETGNISSSHRALNKMAIGIRNGILLGGALVLPTRKLYQYLTDRIGNYEELSHYFDMWRFFSVESGLLIVLAIEYDAIDPNVPLITKGTDGRALR
jgi:hypothetical protein